MIFSGVRIFFSSSLLASSSFTCHAANAFSHLPVGERFQAESSSIQAGTHAHPPVDPFVPRLQAEQAKLAALVEDFIARIQALRQQASAAFAGVQPGEETGEEEPIVILPVDPPAPTDGAVDSDTVIIGKSKDQIQNALKDVPVEVPVHNEL